MVLKIGIWTETPTFQQRGHDFVGADLETNFAWKVRFVVAEECYKNIMGIFITPWVLGYFDVVMKGSIFSVVQHAEGGRVQQKVINV